MSGSWSTQVEQRYALRLPEDVRAWLDKQIWREPGGAEFSRPQTPEQLLDPAPEAIWAGFMLPDTLPIISNNYGDWLCLRIDADGTVAEVLHWSHCGGDWIPYGRTLAEGLLYDAALHVLYPKRASFSDPVPPDRQVFAPAEWARRLDSTVPGDAAPFLECARANRHLLRIKRRYSGCWKLRMWRNTPFGATTSWNMWRALSSLAAMPRWRKNWA